ncbi:MAG: biotin--[acetyl-CoA-carboxylase] ligase [Gemmatimonadetes bacterium]|nr:biotin--[acetyl-CoA-carboxylase] ligase [Gemmatimonadota bacterium]
MTGALLDRWDGYAVEDLRKRWGVPLLETYRSIGSTNDRARAIADMGGAVWSTVVADEQTSGRGRQGTEWISRPGAGLWMSLILDGDGQSGALPVVVGLACAEAMEEMAPAVDVGIKWPNDLLIDDAKVGGVLCERSGARVVVGIGINVAGAPEASAVARLGGLPPVSLEVAAGKPLPRSRLAHAITRNLRKRSDSWVAASHGLDHASLAELNRRDVLVGADVQTDQAGAGRAAGIDASGALRLVGADGVELRVVSGGVRLAPSGVPDRGEA